MNWQTWLLARLKEPSSWLSILKVLTAFAVIHFTPDQQDTIQYLIYTFLGTGALGVAIPDKQLNNGVK